MSDSPAPEANFPRGCTTGAGGGVAGDEFCRHEIGGRAAKNCYTFIKDQILYKLCISTEYFHTIKINEAHDMHVGALILD